MDIWRLFGIFARWAKSVVEYYDKKRLAGEFAKAMPPHLNFKEAFVLSRRLSLAQAEQIFHFLECPKCACLVIACARSASAVLDYIEINQEIFTNYRSPDTFLDILGKELDESLVTIGAALILIRLQTRGYLDHGKMAQIKWLRSRYADAFSTFKLLDAILRPGIYCVR